MLIGIAVDRAGAPHRLCAACRRSVRPAAGDASRMRAGRHRLDRDRAPAPAVRRSIPAGGPSVCRASKKLGENLKTLAADALEAAPAILKSPTAWCGSPAPTGSVTVAELARKGERRPSSDRRRRLQQADRRPIRTAPIWPKSRSIRRPASHDRQLRHGRRFRRDGEPAAAGRPGPWRRGPGHRPGADGGHGLRRRTPASSLTGHA